ncbi:GAD-like domain-containing protein [Roseobacter weihaiensis]|uniref:GAD-like domain-containing protein n=1 Tax=Roseobacter weihaiensis TaxID=2763262 RepID=UPI001D0AC06E|nr:GAD-like domain-containing protein [Roseobacter sp. H9]
MNDLDVIIDRNGPLLEAKSVSVEVINSYRGKIPEMLLELWDTQGIGSWAKGARSPHLTVFLS